MLWYSPLMFEKQYAVASGHQPGHMEKMMKEDPIKNFAVPMALGTLCGALAFYIILHFMSAVKGGLTTSGCITVVFWGWLAFSFLPAFRALIWTHSSPVLLLIDQGCVLFAFVVAALVYTTLTQTTGSNEAAAASPRGRSRSPRRRTPVKRL